MNSRVSKRPSLDLSAIAGLSDVQTVWRCQALELDERSRELRINGALVAIDPRPLEMLMLLMRRPGEVVTRQELVDALWNGRAVTEAVISKCAARLRASLGPDHRNMVRTVHGYGYRLIADPQPLDFSRDSEVAELDVPAPGMALPLRPNWVLEQSLRKAGNIWLGRHVKTGEARIFKLALTPGELDALKREVMIARLLSKSLPQSRCYVPLLDWNHVEPSYFNEHPFYPAGDLSQWVDSRGGLEAVPFEERIACVAAVADALAGAHALGVLHRDIKPSNIFVDKAEDGSPHFLLADFGAGEVLDPARLQALQITQAGGEPARSSDLNWHGTPTYWAPEVVAGERITERSDIYSLGVMLYQFATGSFTRTLSPGWERRIHSPALKKDIEECCDLNPSRRLSDASELARRLRSIDQRDQALTELLRVQQESETARHRLAKSQAIRRWQGAALGLLLLGLGAVTWLAFDLRRAEKAEHAARADQTAVNDFLTHEVLGAADPFRPGGGASVTVAEVLDRAGERLDMLAPEQAEVRAQLATSLATTYQNLMLWPQARAMLEHEYQQSLLALGPQHLTTLHLRIQLAELATEQDDHARAAELLNGLVKRSGPATSNEKSVTPRARYAYAWLLYREGQFKASERDHRELIAALERDGGRSAGLLVDTRWNLAEVLTELGQFKESETLLDGVERHYASLGSQNLVDWVQTSRIAMLLGSGRLEEADKVLTPLVTRSMASLGKHHQIPLYAMHFEGLLRLMQGRNEQARDLFEKSMVLRRELHASSHHSPLYSQGRLGQAQCRLGDTAAGIQNAREAWQGFVETLGEPHIHSLRTALMLGECYRLAGQLPDAETVLIRAIDQAGKGPAADTSILAYLDLELSRTRMEAGEMPRAETALRAAESEFNRVFGGSPSSGVADMGLRQALDDLRARELTTPNSPSPVA